MDLFPITFADFSGKHVFAIRLLDGRNNPANSAGVRAPQSQKAIKKAPSARGLRHGALGLQQAARLEAAGAW